MDVRPAPRSRGAARLVVDGDLEFAIASSGAGTPPPGGRPPFVLVHGVGMSHLSYSRIQPLLSRTRAAHSLDLPGFGTCSPPRREVPIATMAEALGRVLDAAGVHRPVLVGHSMGTQWVLELALQRPADVAGVVMMGPVVDDAHSSLPAQVGALAVDTLREPPTLNRRAATDYLRSRPGWFAGQVRQMMRYPTRERAARLGVPLLVLRGGRDPIAGPAWCARLRDAAPDGRAVVVPAGAHHAQYTSPRAVASALLAFADSLPRAAAVRDDGAAMTEPR